MSRHNFKPLDSSEEALINQIENEDLEPLSDEAFKKEKQQLQWAAKKTVDHVKRKKTVTIRMSVEDVNLLKQKASSLGMPYQTLLNSVIHQYVRGDLS